jgi:hypothetical protein
MKMTTVAATIARVEAAAVGGEARTTMTTMMTIDERLAGWCTTPVLSVRVPAL